MTEDYKEIMNRNPELVMEIALREDLAQIIQTYNTAIFDRNLAQSKANDLTQIATQEKSRLAAIVKADINPILQKRGLPLINPDNEKDLTRFASAFVYYFFERRSR